MAKGKIRISHFTILHNNNNVCTKTKGNRIRRKHQRQLKIECEPVPVYDYDKVYLIFILKHITIVYGLEPYVNCIMLCCSHRHSFSLLILTNVSGAEHEHWIREHVNCDFDKSTHRRRSHRFVSKLSWDKFRNSYIWMVSMRYLNAFT